MKKMSFLWKLKSKIQDHFKNKSLKTPFFKDFSRTTYNSRLIQGIQGIQEPWSVTLYTLWKPYKLGELARKGLIRDELTTSTVSFEWKILSTIGVKLPHLS